MDDPNRSAAPDVPPIAPPGDEPGRTPPPLPTLRTYQDDIADAVKGSNLSAAKIFLAEEERRHQRERIEEATSPESPKNRALLAASLALVLLAAGGFAYFRFFYRAPEARPPAIDVPTFVRVDEVIGIPAEDRSYRDVQIDLSRAATAAIPDREVHQLALTESSGALGDDASDTRQIPASALFGAIGAYPPEQLERSLGERFFIGAYGSSRGTLPFVFLEAANPDLARAAMLAWEESLAADLGFLFPRAKAFADGAGGAGGERVKWEDAVYGNKDVRVLRDGDEDLLMWAFADATNIIVAADPFIVTEMSSRLSRDRELH